MVGGVAGATITMLKSFVEDSPSLPATRTVKFAVVGVVGVPVITPPLPRLKPAGRLPAEIDQA